MKKNLKAWVYLLPALLFIAVFMLYPLVDVFIYSFEEGFNSASQEYLGTGIYNYRYVLRDPYFIQALKNTFILVIITVPLSTLFALLISLALSSIKKLQELYEIWLKEPKVKEYFDAEMRFNVLLADVNKIIGEAVKDVLK